MKDNKDELTQGIKELKRGLIIGKFMAYVSIALWFFCVAKLILSDNLLLWGFYATLIGFIIIRTLSENKRLKSNILALEYLRKYGKEQS